MLSVFMQVVKHGFSLNKSQNHRNFDSSLFNRDISDSYSKSKLFLSIFSVQLDDRNETYSNNSEIITY